LENEVEHGRRRRSPNYPLEFKRKLAQQASELDIQRILCRRPRSDEV